MIPYHPGKWGIFFIFSTAGSVFPRALALSLPAALVAGLFNLIPSDHDAASEMLGFDGSILLNAEGANVLWSSYSFVLGFLIVFRNSQAYSRFWEGAELVHQVRGEWFNAVSSLVAFCNQDEAKTEQVLKFQHCTVRLMSMLHCAALQLVAEVADDRFGIIDPAGIDEDRLKYLAHRDPNERCQILLQWLQRLIVEAEASGTLKIAPPILSRVYQELSRGIVNLHNATKIKEIRFPFPYAQMVTVMLFIYGVMTPIIASRLIESGFWSCFMTLMVVTSYWSLYYIALEIEQPFGEDANDLPVSMMQNEMNKSLMMLLEAEVSTPPTFHFSQETLTLHIVASSVTAVPAAASKTLRKEAYIRLRDSAVLTKPNLKIFFAKLDAAAEVSANATSSAIGAVSGLGHRRVSSHQAGPKTSMNSNQGSATKEGQLHELPIIAEDIKALPKDSPQQGVVNGLNDLDRYVPEERELWPKVSPTMPVEERWHRAKNGFGPGEELTIGDVHIGPKEQQADSGSSAAVVDGRAVSNWHPLHNSDAAC